METTPDNDEIQPDDQTLTDPDPGFGEQEEAGQEQEWTEDAQEGGATEP